MKQIIGVVIFVAIVILLIKFIWKLAIGVAVIGVLAYAGYYIYKRKKGGPGK